MRKPASPRTPENVSGLRTQRFAPRTIVALIIGALLTGLVVVYGIPTIKDRRQKRLARELTAQAGEKVADGEWDAANRLLGRAYQIDPRDPETLRLTARAIEQMPGGAERAGYFWRQLIESRQAKSEDLIAYANSLLRDGAREEAMRWFNSIPASEKSSRPALELKAAFLRLDGQAEQAEKMLRAAYLADSANPESRLKLALLDLASPFAEVQEDATARLWQIAESRGSESSNAMRILANQTRLTPAQAATLRRLLARIPDAKEDRRLSIVTGIVRALPAERETIIAAETEKRRGLPFEKTAPFIRWLAENNEHERLLSLLPADQAIRTGELFVSYVTAMEQTRRWAELTNLIRREPNIPVPGPTKALILARCARSLNEPGEKVRSYLQDGLHQAILSKDRLSMINIGNTADECGQPELAIDAFGEVATLPQYKLQMLERMLQVRQRQHDLTAMIDLINRCLKEQPANPAYVETWCYLKLLEGSEMEKAADTIRQDLQTYPLRAPTASLIASLAAYRCGDLEEAGRAAAGAVVWKLPPGQRAVLSGILEACGRSSEAFQIAEKVPENILLTEENRFLQMAL